MFEFFSLLKQNDFESKPSFDSNLELSPGTPLPTRRIIGAIDWKRPPILSHISLKDIVFLYELMIYLMCWSLLYYLIKLHYSPSISLISSLDHKWSRWGRYMFNTSKRNVTVPPWWVHVAQQAAHWACSCCYCWPIWPWHNRIRQQWTWKIG